MNNNARIYRVILIRFYIQEIREKIYKTISTSIHSHNIEAHSLYIALMSTWESLKRVVYTRRQK